MPNIGPMELILILAIALLVLGPGKLPEVGKSLGASIREFRKATTDIQDAVKLDPTPTPPAPVAAAPAAPPPAAAVAAPNTLTEGTSPNQLSGTGADPAARA
jgi:sec-independent protein translocase protein TatA